MMYALCTIATILISGNLIRLTLKILNKIFEKQDEEGSKDNKGNA